MKKNYRIGAIALSMICIIFSIILIVLNTNKSKASSNQKDLKSKVEEEINYSNYNIIDALNQLNNISIERYKFYLKGVNINSQSQNAIQNQEGNQNNSNLTQNQISSNETNNTQSQNDNKNNSNGESDTATEELIKQSEKQEIDWNKITNIYENLYSLWPTMNLDLKEAEIDAEYINNYNVALNGVAQSIKSKDKNSCLINLYNLYAQLPTFMISASHNQYSSYIYSTKMNVLNAYVLANQDNKWEEMSVNVKKARENFDRAYEIKNSTLKNSDKEGNEYEKLGIMIDNLENCIVLNDTSIFYMYYKNVIQELETIT